jgi:outer membrane protein W
MKRFVLVLAIVALAAPLAAQEKKEVFAFFDSPGGGWSENAGTTFSTGYGVALRYFATPNLSTELSVAQRSVTIDAVRSRTNPIDLIAAWHFPNDSHWKPYLGLGLHYLRADGLDSRSGGEVTGGVAYQFSPRFFVRADANVLLQRHNPAYDQRSRSWIGFGWRF